MVTRPVLVHVGAPKTGTSFVQDLLFTHRARLRERGVLYAADRFDAHFLAALDLLHLPWGGLERRPAAPGTGWPLRSGTGPAPRSSVTRSWPRRRARRSLVPSSRSRDDTEVHVVYSARDLVRQIPAEWQENVKHRRSRRYADFLETNCVDPAREGAGARGSGGSRRCPTCSTAGVRRSTARAGPPGDRAAARGSAADLLWERFAAVFGLDPTEFDTEAVRANASLGVARGRDYIRRLNVRRERGTAEPQLPPARPRAPRAPEPFRAARLTAALGARRRAGVGRATSAAGGSSELALTRVRRGRRARRPAAPAGR